MLRASIISLAGLSAISMPVFLSYSNAPKLVFSSRGGRNGTQLSWDYESFLKDGKIEAGKQVPFKDSKLKFGNYQLREGDVLCSPDQDGTYLVMKKKGGRDNEYSIEGSDQVWQKCPDKDFFKTNPNVKTVQFKGFKLPFNSNLYSSSILISSCYFELRKSRTDSKFEILWDKCKKAEPRGTSLRTATMTLDY